MASRTQVLALYRSLLREATHIDNYNFRLHALRKVKGEFRESTALSGADIGSKFAGGREQLESLRRQRIVSQLYPEGSNIMES